MPIVRFNPFTRRIVGASNHSRVDYEPALCLRIWRKTLTALHVNQPVTIDRFRSTSPDDAKSNDGKPCCVLIFTSPKAGSGASREQVSRLLQLLEESAIDCVVVHSPDELKHQLASREQTREVVVVAAGGDGTMSLAVTSSAESLPPNAGSERDVPIVPMPLGTENLLARQFGHTATAESVVKTIRYGTSYRLDAGIANDNTFLIMATCGFDAEVVRGMHLTRKGHIRRISYLGPIVRALRNYAFPRVTIRIDEKDTIECCWAMVFNLPRYAAGLAIEPIAIGDDGKMDVIAFQRGSILSGLRYLAGILLGRHLKFSDVVRRRGKVIEISSESRVPYQLDGDYIGRLPLRITTLPGRVHLLVPPAE